ncbi:hypothetical protein N0V86_000080 [Didymella sp. IMI 355093]|nr:hypothetical protein N0V86_000080 [Didymella sp. IMI 355093]
MRDSREQVFNKWTPPVRQGELHYRDDFGALFFYLSDVLRQFCAQLRDLDISIKMFGIDATQLHQHVEAMSFDRIEVSNICDLAFLKPAKCIDSFYTLLKPKPENPHATLLLLFITAIAEMNSTHFDPKRLLLENLQGCQRVEKYVATSPEFIAYAVRHELDMMEQFEHPDFFKHSSNFQRLVDHDAMWKLFEDTYVANAVHSYGLKIKDKHTIVKPWAFKAWPYATQEEFDHLRAGSTVGSERYLELEYAE